MIQCAFCHETNPLDCECWKKEIDCDQCSKKHSIVTACNEKGLFKVLEEGLGSQIKDLRMRIEKIEKLHSRFDSHHREVAPVDVTYTPTLPVGICSNCYRFSIYKDCDHCLNCGAKKLLNWPEALLAMMDGRRIICGSYLYEWREYSDEIFYVNTNNLENHWMIWRIAPKDYDLSKRQWKVYEG